MGVTTNHILQSLWKGEYGYVYSVKLKGRNDNKNIDIFHFAPTSTNTFQWSTKKVGIT